MKVSEKIKTAATVKALRERMERVRREKSGRRLADELAEIADEFKQLPVFNTRTADEILGYDDNGLPS